jgi:hypothetical protein
MNVPSALEAIIRFVMRDTTYHKHYTATVQGPVVGDTVDLLPDDPAIRGAGLSGVPIMYGLPGVSAKVLPGTKMTLFFENGDPQKPRAAMWEGGHIELSFNDGVMPIARVGDQITITSALAGSGPTALPVTGVGIITGGAPTVKA